ncbi:28558_t:CDS:2, partial [Dentiscutata erythropus]
MANLTTYTYEDIPIDNNTIKYFLSANSNKLSYAEFIKVLSLGKENFLDTFEKALNEATNKLSAYFWECPPVHKAMKNKPFEFVVTKSTALNYNKQDYSSFKEKITNNFTKNAPKEQQIKFWQEVAIKLAECLEI